MANAELTFKDTDAHLVVIMPSVVERLLDHRQLDPLSDEAAGVLIGERRGPHIVIQRLSEPGKGDIRNRHSVNRLGAHHQIAVDKAFASSKGTFQYLGEWHTHPEDAPSPSQTDTSSWATNLVDIEPMILIIVGRQRIWAAKKIGRKLVPLTEI